MSLLTSVAAQTIRDHKVNFNYIQLPNQPLDENIKSYSVHLVKNYEEEYASTLAQNENSFIIFGQIIFSNSKAIFFIP